MHPKAPDSELCQAGIPTLRPLQCLGCSKCSMTGKYEEAKHVTAEAALKLLPCHGGSFTAKSSLEDVIIEARGERVGQLIAEVAEVVVVQDASNAGPQLRQHSACCIDKFALVTHLQRARPKSGEALRTGGTMGCCACSQS